MASLPAASSKPVNNNPSVAMPVIDLTASSPAASPLLAPAPSPARSAVPGIHSGSLVAASHSLLALPHNSYYHQVNHPPREQSYAQQQDNYYRQGSSNPQQLRNHPHPQQRNNNQQYYPSSQQQQQQEQQRHNNQHYYPPSHQQQQNQQQLHHQSLQQIPQQNHQQSLEDMMVYFYQEEEEEEEEEEDDALLGSTLIVGTISGPAPELVNDGVPLSTPQFFIPPHLLREYADMELVLNPAATPPCTIGQRDAATQNKKRPADFIKAGLCGARRTPFTSAFLAETGQTGSPPVGTDGAGSLYIRTPGNHTNPRANTSEEERPFRFEASRHTWMGYGREDMSNNKNNNKRDRKQQQKNASGAGASVVGVGGVYGRIVAGGGGVVGGVVGDIDPVYKSRKKSIIRYAHSAEEDMNMDVDMDIITAHQKLVEEKIKRFWDGNGKENGIGKENGNGKEMTGRYKPRLRRRRRFYERCKKRFDEVVDGWLERARSGRGV